MFRDPEAPRFTVHRIVRDVTNRRLGLGPPAHRARLVEALEWVNAEFVGNAADVRTRPVADPLAPHAVTIAERADKAGIADPTARLMGKPDNRFDGKAQYARAETFCRRALHITEASLGNAHPAVAIDSARHEAGPGKKTRTVLAAKRNLRASVPPW